MSDVVQEIAGRRVLICAVDGPHVRGEGEAVDIVGEALGQGVAWVALPTVRLDPEFFRLASGLAGKVAQKFVTYERRLAIVGDIGPELARSGALSDWVRESNRGSQIWFVADMAELEARLAAQAPP